MELFTQTINLVSALGTLTIGVFALVGIILHAIHFKKPHPILDQFTNWLLWIGFGIALSSIMFSLIYSGVIGYAPCQLCWWQRIAIYPQVLLYGIAMMTNDRKVFRYTLALSLIGVLFALYHNYLELGGNSLIACDAAVSCTAIYVNQFDFVTIPLMSLLSQIGLTAIAWIGLSRNAK